MVENKQQSKNKKSIFLWRIFRWVGLPIFILLLIAAVYFHAPWKIITLLAIILAACTILPGSYRKWFWLLVGAVVITLIIWVFLPEDNKDWRRYEYSFDKELKTLGVKRSIPDEQNAAIIYGQLMESYDSNDYNIYDINDSDPNIFDKTFSNPWLSKDYPEIADRLKHIQSTMEILIEISKIKLCIFPISDPSNNELQLDRNSAIRSWARLLVIVINNDVAEGRIDKAVEKIQTNLQMSRHLYQQPTTLDFLVGVYIERLAIRQFNRFVIEDEITGNHVNKVERAFSDIQNDWNSVFNNIIIYDKLCIKTELSKYYEVNTKGRTRLSRDPLAQLRSNAVYKFIY